jgi:hypothetical protein
MASLFCFGKNITERKESRIFYWYRRLEILMYTGIRDVRHLFLMLSLEGGPIHYSLS